MGTSIKYLNYNVVRAGATIHSGTVPAIIADGGTNKDYDHGGIWLTQSAATPTVIEYTDADGKVWNMPSDATKHEWISYSDKIKAGLGDESLYNYDGRMGTAPDLVCIRGCGLLPPDMEEE